MTNVTNGYGVSYSKISFFMGILNSHVNVKSVNRHRDILFTVNRKNGDPIDIVCLEEYACGVIKLIEVLQDFPSLNIIYVGGAWNGYTKDAKAFCLSKKLGLFNSKEINGALHRSDYWAYTKKDEEGNPEYFFTKSGD